MVLPGATLRWQLLFDLIAPPLLVCLAAVGRFYDDARVSKPDRGVAISPWVWVLVALYLWFFAGTIWHFFLSPGTSH